MLKNLSFLLAAGALAMTTACIVTVTDDATTNSSLDTTTGDGDPSTGDGDPSTGDGDGDPGTGDGDGDPTTGDGDGDPTTGDGDGDPPAGGCGWIEAEGYYGCGGVGEDPSGTNPLACPDGVAADAACGDTDPAVTGVGCCVGDVNYYCTQDMTVFEEDCGPA